jgi:hypothetical protein
MWGYVTNAVILAGAEEDDVRGVDAWFLHAPAGADHASVPTMVIDAIRVSCDYRPSRLAGRRTPQRPLIPVPICRLAPGGTAAARRRQPLGDHGYLVRIREGAEEAEVRFQASTAVLDELNLTGADEAQTGTLAGDIRAHSMTLVNDLKGEDRRFLLRALIIAGNDTGDDESGQRALLERTGNLVSVASLLGLRPTTASLA